MTFNDFKYQVMPRAHLSDGHITLRAVCPQDIESIRVWRNEQMSVLRQNAIITPEEQKQYFIKHVWQEKNCIQPKQILLAILQDDILIGYGGLVNIKWNDKKAEISFLLSTDIENNKENRANIFECFLRIICDTAFIDLKLSRLWTETYSNRADHIKVLETAGFLYEGLLKHNVIIKGIPTDAILHAKLKHEWKKDNERL